MQACCVDSLIIRCIWKGLNTKNIEIATLVRLGRTKPSADRDDFTALRERKHFNELDYLPNGAKTHSVTMNEVDLAVECVTSSGTVATKPDFDVKAATKGTLFNCVSFVILFKQTLL